MKLLMIFCTGACDQKLRDLVESLGVHAYTEIPEAMGAGSTGKHFGTRAWPGASSVILTAVESAKADELMSALADFSKRCLPEQGVRAVLLPVEKLL